MAGFAKRLTSYVRASANAKLDEKADPKIQIQQAIEEAQKQHAQLTQQAAAVIGNQHQIEMKMARGVEEAQKLQTSARQALMLADKARAAGDVEKAASYDTAAQTFAGQLVTVEGQVNDLKALHEQAVQSSAAAHAAVENNRRQLEAKLNERSKLLTQLEQAKMQESMNKAVTSMSALNAPGANPTLDSVREKIEGRYATALGSSELNHDTVDAQMLEVQKATLDATADARLEQIRASLAAPPSTAIDSGPAQQAPALNAGGHGDGLDALLGTDSPADTAAEPDQPAAG